MAKNQLIAILFCLLATLLTGCEEDDLRHELEALKVENAQLSNSLEQAKAETKAKLDRVTLEKDKEILAREIDIARLKIELHSDYTKRLAEKEQAADQAAKEIAVVSACNTWPRICPTQLLQPGLAASAAWGAQISGAETNRYWWIVWAKLAVAMGGLGIMAALAWIAWRRLSIWWEAPAQRKLEEQLAQAEEAKKMTDGIRYVIQRLLDHKAAVEAELANDILAAKSRLAEAEAEERERLASEKTGLAAAVEKLRTAHSQLSAENARLKRRYEELKQQDAELGAKVVELQKRRDSHANAFAPPTRKK